MRINVKTIIIIACIFSVFAGIALAQIPENKTELEVKHKSLLKEITETQKLLTETQKERQVSMSQLKALRNQVSNRQTLINNIDREIREVNKDIVSKTHEINELTSQIEKLRMIYAQSVRYSYKYQSAHNILAFIFTADNFNDGMRRYQYMKKNRDFRKHQADRLKNGQKKIENNIQKLDGQKKKNVELKNTQVEQKKVILEESQMTELMVNELRGKEKDLTASIDKKRSDARKLDAVIKNIIQEEIRITQRKKAEEERKRLEEENKRREELARIERERLAQEEQKKKQQEEESRRLASERQRIQQQQRERELLAKNDVAENAPSTTAAVPSAPKKEERPAPQQPVAAVPAEVKADARPVAQEQAKTTIVASNSSPVKPPKSAALPDNPPPTYKNSLSPDMQTTSSNFAANKGRLPSPVSGGYISAPFGKYPHPLEPKVTLENMGIDIASRPGTAVKCVFNGSVTTVVSIAGTYTVIVNHGEYFTVYSNLSSVNVSKGQPVSTNQQVGIVGENDEGEHIVHFEVCRVGKNNSIINENPSAWISR